MTSDNLPPTGEELERVIAEANREFDEYVASGRYAEDQERMAEALEESRRASEEFLASDEYKRWSEAALAEANREFDEYVASGRAAEDGARIEAFLTSDEYKATLAEALAAMPTADEIAIALSEDGTPSVMRPQDR